MNAHRPSLFDPDAVVVMQHRFPPKSPKPSARGFVFAVITSIAFYVLLAISGTAFLITHSDEIDCSLFHNQRACAALEWRDMLDQVRRQTLINQGRGK